MGGKIRYIKLTTCLIDCVQAIMLSQVSFFLLSSGSLACKCTQAESMAGTPICCGALVLRSRVGLWREAAHGRGQKPLLHSLCVSPSARHFRNISLLSLEVRHCLGASVFSIEIYMLLFPPLQNTFNHLAFYIYLVLCFSSLPSLSHANLTRGFDFSLAPGTLTHTY